MQSRKDDIVNPILVAWSQAATSKEFFLNVLACIIFPLVLIALGVVTKIYPDVAPNLFAPMMFVAVGAILILLNLILLVTRKLALTKVYGSIQKTNKQLIYKIGYRPNTKNFIYKRRTIPLNQIISTRVDDEEVEIHFYLTKVDQPSVLSIPKTVFDKLNIATLLAPEAPDSVR